MSKFKKVILIVISVIILTFLVLIGLYLYKDKFMKIDVNFIFETELDLYKEYEVNSNKYDIEKAIVTVNDNDVTDLLNIDTSNIDLTKLGTYAIKYYIIYKEKKYETERHIKIVDNTPPTIKLNGKNITILVNEKYVEPGYVVTDNYDSDLETKIEIINEIDNTKPGKYKITYKVADNSGNATETTREVTVKKPNTVVAVPKKEEKVAIPKVVVTEYNNTLKKNKFNKNNILLEGYVKEPLEENIIKLVGESTYEFPVNVNNNTYSINLNIEDVNNGNYALYINEERILNKIASIERLSRAKVGNKLVTFSYNEQGEVTINIENHAYVYDILINPGHGADDSGAVNAYITEKEMNLTVSLYEKCRYEAHGLSVYLTRASNDVYSSRNFGPSGLSRLHKLAYEMGYYGAISKIVYSNHHNSIGNNYYSGYEILIPGALTKEELQPELAIVNKWNSIFTLTETHKRFYAKDYDTETPYSKLNGEVYNFKDNYAVNRIPYQIANVKSIIFEDCYMSNKNEFRWYWLENNWYMVSEAKIEAYITSLGLSYNSDNTSCIS